ncbi:glutamate synthase subunit beta [Clostridia bacterium]|nr:glutamate synthase subunit beta [Clostridia bacterium]
MGKPTGFLEYTRKQVKYKPAIERIKDFHEFHEMQSEEVQKEQAARCMDCGVPFCQSGTVFQGMVSGCPLGNLIPEWNDFLYHNMVEQAFYRLKKTNNFPEFTSRVCPAPCEYACTCSLNGEAVTIKENERSITEKAYALGLAKARPPILRTGKKIAVVGSGPAGLTVADRLNQKGHSVTVFEREDRAGGLLMYGIPNMKLEKKIVEEKIKVLEEEGILFAYDSEVGKNIKAKQLKEEFAAIVLACGASEPRDISVKGREGKGIHFAVDYLKSATKSLLDPSLAKETIFSAQNKRVLVIGGGDTGNDCIGTAIRQGAKSVLQLEIMPELPEQRRKNNPWPEWAKIKKTDYGQEEAAAVFGEDPRVYETTVKEFLLNEKGEVKKAILAKVGQAPLFPLIEGSEREIDVDMVLIAAGFSGTQSAIAKAFDLTLDQRNNIPTQLNRFQTEQKNIFACGDTRRGQSLVVWAIREGREAAEEVHQALLNMH